MVSYCCELCYSYVVTPRNDGGEEGNHSTGVIHCAHQVCEILGKIQGKGGPDGKQFTEVFLGPLIGQKVGTRMLRDKIPAQHSPHLSVSY